MKRRSSYSETTL